MNGINHVKNKDATMHHAKKETRQLMDDLRAIVEDAEALLKAAAGEADEKTEDVRSRAEGSIRAARERLQDIEEDLRTRARDADHYVHENPWAAVAMAAGAGFIMGLLASRR
ncbi:MAG: DUF883 family protein [Steroidobacteraceae bacterium]